MQNYSQCSAGFCILLLMRIIAGSKRGLKLLSPKGDASRPIIDRVKESVFDVLYNYDLPAASTHVERRGGRPAGALVADLFSGVGSLGLEALSRGAGFVTFVERDPEIGTVLRKNIERGGFAGKSKVIRADAFSIGAPVDAEMGKYRLVFVDPPYKATRDVGEKSQLAKLMGILAEQVANDGLVIVRTKKGTDLLDCYGVFEVFQRRSWGTMNVTILRKKTIATENSNI
jgi:16S rRNA (guanine966-N2)-methyltransferase